jgi:hypothetical protein
MIANPERGEYLLEIGSARVVVCAEMKALASFSRAVNASTMNEVVMRLNGSEPNALYAFLDAFTVQGDAEAAKAAVKTFKEVAAIAEAIGFVLAVLFEGPPSKKAEGATPDQ